MSQTVRWFVAALKFTVKLVALVVLAGSPQAAHAQSVDNIIQWNRTMFTALGVPGANPPTVFITRPLAIVSAAVFDAANSFDRLYQPYTTWSDPAPGASRDAAVAHGFDNDAAFGRLQHVVDGQRRDSRRHHRLHLDAGLPRHFHAREHADQRSLFVWLARDRHARDR